MPRTGRRLVAGGTGEAADITAAPRARSATMLHRQHPHVSATASATSMHELCRCIDGRPVSSPSPQAWMHRTDLASEASRRSRFHASGPLRAFKK
jgi:hypothetical protein